MTNNDTWYGDWFNTPYYHILYKNRDANEAEFFLTHLFQKLNLPANSRLCDLACGKGRHAYIMNKLGYTVAGLDLSENSIATAKELENASLKFAVHDMLQPFGAHIFDGIFNLFTSFGYFNHVQKNYHVLKNIYNALKNNGVLVIDFFNAQWVINTVVAKEFKLIEGIKFEIRKRIENEFIIKEIIFSDKGQQFYFTEKVQLIFKKDFETMLQNTNFAVEQVWGDYELKPFNEDSSKRLIILARKKCAYS